MFQDARRLRVDPTKADVSTWTGKTRAGVREGEGIELVPALHALTTGTNGGGEERRATE